MMGKCQSAFQLLEERYSDIGVLGTCHWVAMELTFRELLRSVLRCSSSLYLPVFIWFRGMCLNSLLHFKNSIKS